MCWQLRRWFPIKSVSPSISVDLLHHGMGMVWRLEKTGVPPYNVQLMQGRTVRISSSGPSLFLPPDRNKYHRIVGFSEAMRICSCMCSSRTSLHLPRGIHGQGVHRGGGQVAHLDEISLSSCTRGFPSAVRNQTGRIGTTS